MSLVRRLKLLKGKEKHSFHYPGHKNRLEELGFSRYDVLDTTETFGTDNLLDPKGILKNSMEKTAKIFGTNYSFYGVGGSTMSLYAALFAATSRGDKILVQRNVHKSVFQGMAILGLQPDYLPSKFQEEDIKEVEEKLKSGDYKVALLVSPDYYGFLLPLDRLISLFHKYNILVIVDEAHGGHLIFSEELCSYSALKNKADLVIHSVHKTLPGLTGTSLLHVNSNRLDYHSVLKGVRYFTTTSPSYPLLSSIEESVDYMNEIGREDMGRLLDGITSFWELVKPGGIYPIYEEEAYDRTKVYVKVPGMKGSDLYYRLYERYGLAMEFFDTEGVLAVCTFADEKEDLNRLAAALNNIGSTMEHFKGSSLPPMPLPRVVATLSETLMAKKVKIPLGEAVGHVAAESITPYPPGIPLIVGGEEFSTEIVEIVIQLLKDELVIQGIDNGYVEVLE
ncbi:MAG: aminotransferase class I/II-fold pyridoxal phosphate-dependent enzyme [Tissierellia bacterium]|nr:aminotransferase class I/II-fold pyridoxal phosphate-dependent enzyme [Tissierellia bacterium]